MRYGIIGNCKTAALVHESGSIDWCCLPNFDSPSAFAAILDPQGGHFRVSSVAGGTTHQTYLPQTNILETTFDDGNNTFSVIDFMPRYREGSIYRCPTEIHRLIRPRKGHPSAKVSFHPNLNYAAGQTEIHLSPPFLLAHDEVEDVYLYSNLPLVDILEEKPVLIDGDKYLLLTYHEKIVPPNLGYTHEMLDKTKEYWEGWAVHCRLPSVAPEAVLRSALTLKLMTFQDTGAIIAAPTTSLPESLDEGRNWDYRYCWLRDASMMLEALKSIGHFEEAKAFIHFLLRIFESRQSQTQIAYGIDGRTDLKEKELPHLKGYRNSRPVRIGNRASQTQQNDIYGQMLNALYLYY
ncbi:MAG: glycoside hydrolase family 15 protein, partial [Deltaproteobacteria bacterium]|nr:glycoside hydrolase family 15 protein [Deltaproteobacteria bacterium]